MANTVLHGACLGEADISGAQLDAAMLTGADLRKANLRGAGFRNARLDEADLRDALGSWRDVLEFPDLDQVDEPAQSFVDTSRRRRSAAAACCEALCPTAVRA